MMTGIITAQEKDSTSIEKITGKAIWGPGMGMMHAIHDSCDSMKYPSFGDCFLEQMKKFGASPEAVEFTKLTGSEGFMRDFKETGKVDVAYAVYPFRANENQLCFLVNGSPNMIDVDNYDFISKIDFKKNKIYKQILKEYPHVSIWPGDRSGTDYPAIRQLPEGGSSLFSTTACRMAAMRVRLIGFADLGFNFDQEGKFVAIKVINVLRLNKSGNELKVQNEYSNSAKIIKIKSGQCFTIALKSNATTGYGWQLAKPLNENIVNNIGKIYLPPKIQYLAQAEKKNGILLPIIPAARKSLFKYIPFMGKKC